MAETHLIKRRKVENGESNEAIPDDGFDPDMIAAVIGEHLPGDTLRRLKDVSGGNLERAINMYFDGSWNASSSFPQQSNAFGPLQPMSSPRKRPAASSSSHATERRGEPSSVTATAAESGVDLKSMPGRRYLGAFGVGGWATRSGTSLLQHGQEVRIERQKMTSKPQGSKKATIVRRKTQDIVVRFTDPKGQEVGRLPQETAEYISALLDQKIIALEGTCVYAPEQIRTNDTIFLQLRCYMLREAFERRLAPLDSETTDFFGPKETEDERAMRMRQVGLVKLFSEIGLEPIKSNGLDQKSKRAAILDSAEEPKATQPDPEAEEGKELEQDQLDALYRKAQSFDFNSPEAEPADTFALNLRPYQKQALHWLLNKERNVANREDVSMHPLWEEYPWPTQDLDGNHIPPVEGAAQFYVNPYSGELSLDFPRQEQNCLGGILADEMGLGKTIEMLSLIHTNKSPSDYKPKKTIPGILEKVSTTLVVAPMSLLSQWELETEAASKEGTLKPFVYYGNDKKSNLQLLLSSKGAPDVIITSYGTVLSEYNQVLKGGTGDGGLFSICFYRIILDEAHYIKNRLSKTAKACYELLSEHRWVLTGTPIVNRLEDLFSLVKFLRVDPWQSFTFWKSFITTPFENKEFLRALDVVQTVLEPLVLRRTKDMKLPNGDPLVPLPGKTTIIEKVQLSNKEREVYDFIQDRAKKTFKHNLEAGTLMKSYTSILAQILRLRQSCCHPTLIRKKEAVADELEAEAAYDVANGLADDMDLNELLDRFSVESSGNETNANTYGAHVLKQIKEEVEGECTFCCAEPMENQSVTSCFHAACRDCWFSFISHERELEKLPLCPSCRSPINERDIFEVVRGDDNNNDEEVLLRRVNSSHTSAKLHALIAKLKDMRKTEPDTKATVFSQFTSFLDLIGPALARERIPFVRFDGSMSQQARKAVIDQFKKHHGGMVMLLSLKAGGVGLNLTEAKRVFMMDPWWSFAVEAQAIDRVHRMGQMHDVTVHRFVVEDSVEERMINKIQARKKFIASSLGMMGDEEKKQVWLSFSDFFFESWWWWWCADADYIGTHR
ncbi:putative DNA repair protein [Sphaerosporella brunnea]|uniref:Putative DNA repair protein n=1 Tax=Sphaerosporella brunnea TaxID=1250544 RepID=A0A5J5EZV7_9PEZI|nr:putative DNA repair protein [Sphaerosporella brunnea]